MPNNTNKLSLDRRSSVVDCHVKEDSVSKCIRSWREHHIVLDLGADD